MKKNSSMMITQGGDPVKLKVVLHGVIRRIFANVARQSVPLWRLVYPNSLWRYSCSGLSMLVAERIETSIEINWRSLRLRLREPDGSDQADTFLDSRERSC